MTTTVMQTEAPAFTTPAAPQLPAVVPPAALPSVPSSGSLGDLLAGRPHLAGALCAAQQAVQSVAPDRRNEYHKYNYASAEAILLEARHLSGAGLALVPIEETLDGWQRDGPDRFQLICRYLLIHGASGETLPLIRHWPVCPEKGRPLDKATAAASTLSLAYLLRDLLQIPRVAPADDVAARDDRPAQQEQPKPAPKKEGKPKKAPPANGAELYERLQAKGTEVLKAVVAAGAKAGFPAEMQNWDAAQIGYGTTVASEFIKAAKPAPAPQAQTPAPIGPAPQPQREVGEPDPGEQIDVAERANLTKLMEDAKLSWSDCITWINRELPAKLGFGASPSDLTFGQYGPLVRALKERIEAIKPKKAG